VEKPAVGGFVLAGGQSSRMGRNKALLELGGKPLVWHAVTKLQRLCRDVAILSSDLHVAAFGPLVQDVHPGCGPLGGVEAALLHSAHDWNLFLPVDVPFIPTTMLNLWLGDALKASRRGLRAMVIAVDATVHPTLLVIHREMVPYLSYSLDRGHTRLLSALEYGAEKIAITRDLKVKDVFWVTQYDDFYTPAVDAKTEPWAKRSSVPWPRGLDEFANLNTPEEFARAELYADALDTKLSGAADFDGAAG
jgi:molybdopterin-guanine dinucleotide biosynthesis protein A